MHNSRQAIRRDELSSVRSGARVVPGNARVSKGEVAHEVQRVRREGLRFVDEIADGHGALSMAVL